ncbi:MAG: 30S ribosome-binding factor RbfA [Sedimenticola sp.]|uniref:Ribosome-binding factor A n=1 Tax=Sedimenticola thiotaurini TaxID=1543721 RepID=A0A558D2A0_9GAMM|nr:30S ribosome-binding factor RbfA [Sedimenticola sp.]TVT55141.1 MAG: 30S ribosome-binding factor RbfA [Sedimenticola thiotaurini]MCW8949255.1 30S ribosome-binding factor RbfA [Sedimenticola sp.]MCW8976351.1 30S ribosome-binding factor RbfA [Sedimenticola sp.]MCW9021552.1 30S ribosome-binding factor RbfA [Sedimenticola sp.]
MAREFKRTDRIGAQIQRELAELVRTSFDVRKIGMVTIQAVQVVRDFSHAKIFFTFFGGELDQQGVTKMLKQAAPKLRHELGQRIRMRTVPELHFVYDESIERGSRISSLIEQAVQADHHAPDDKQDD